MSHFNGATFVSGLSELAEPSRNVFAQHGKNPDGRRSLVEQIADEAMLRLMQQADHRLSPRDCAPSPSAP